MTKKYKLPLSKKESIKMYVNGEDFYLLSPMCDYAFRKGIVDTLVAISMNIDAIEEGIEKNANI